MLNRKEIAFLKIYNNKDCTYSFAELPTTAFIPLNFATTPGVCNGIQLPNTESWN